MISALTFPIKLGLIGLLLVMATVFPLIFIAADWLRYGGL